MPAKTSFARPKIWAAADAGTHGQSGDQGSANHDLRDGYSYPERRIRGADRARISPREKWHRDPLAAGRSRLLVRGGGVTSYVSSHSRSKAAPKPGRLGCPESEWASRCLRSASAFSGPSNAHRIRITPGERKAQYRRNFALATGSVATARVSVRKIDALAAIASARSVQTI